jgi:hypothetical protein
MLLLAASLAGQSSAPRELLARADASSDEMLIDKICGPSLDVLGQSGDTVANAERSIGLQEINMNRQSVPESDKKTIRSMCTIYNAGAQRMANIIMQRMQSQHDASGK